MSSVGAGPGLVDAARRAIDAAQERPAAALAAAREVLAQAGDDIEVQALARWAAGLAQRELNQLAAADTELRLAVELADALGRGDVAAGARTSWALVLANLGRPDEGLAELDRAEPAVTGAELGRVQMQRALILQRQGRLEDALRDFDLALPSLVAAGDRLAQARLHINRGIALAYRDELGAADDDLRTARSIALDLGQAMLAAMCAHNLGFVNGRRGDVPAALASFDWAEAEYAQLQVDAGLAAVLLVDRAQVVLDAGLAREALATSSRAVALLEPTGNSAELAEADLLAARAALAAGDEPAARTSAQRAADAFTGQDRAGWAVLAEYVVLTAGDGNAQDAAALAERLDLAGWTVEASSAHHQAARRALDDDDPEAAAEQLERAARSRTAAPAAARVAGWHAEALRQQLAGNRRAQRRAIRTGLAELHRHRATLGATDLRAHAGAYGTRLADLAVEDALRHGGPADLLVAAESWRAGSLASSARPPADPELADLLERLRAATARRRDEPGAAADEQLRRVEDAVRDLVRARPGNGSLATLPELDRPALHRRLGDRILVEWVAHRGTLHAVTIADGRARYLELGPLAAAVDAIASIRMCLLPLASARGSARSLDAARTTLAAAAEDATRALFGPLVRRLEGRSLVLVPTGALHATPWLALDLVRATPTSVAPSARTWLAAGAAPRRAGLLLAAGPDLPGAAAEIATLADALPGAIAFGAQQATVGAVLAELPAVGVAHLAAHGTFRTDNPQFSSLRLADGELTVYDLETLPRTPDVLVLSACDAAATGVRAGDELLGLSAAVLALGTGSLVAPSVPVPDDVTAPLMVGLQRRLATGMAAPEALRDAIADADGTDPTAFAAVRSFVAWGA